MCFKTFIFKEIKIRASTSDRLLILFPIYIYRAKRCACKGLCTSLQNKTLLKTVFIWNVVLCTCKNEWIYSTDNFSNQAVVDFKIQSSHTEKKRAEKWPPKTDIHVPSDFRHFAYKQIASTWSNNYWFVCGNIILYNFEQPKMTALLWNHWKHHVCSDPCICTTQQCSFFSSEVLHEVWRRFFRSFDIIVASDVPTKYLFCTKQTRKQSHFIDNIRHIMWPFLNDFILPGRMAWVFCSETLKGVL